MRLDVLDDVKGEPTDWWFIYKVPVNSQSTGAATEATGHEYVYFEAGQGSGVALSANDLGAQTSALFRTLAQLSAAQARNDQSVGWILYNDEQPGDDPDDDGDMGHSKGVLAYDLETDTAFWLLHSWPKFPSLAAATLDAYSSYEYGQTYLCVALKDVATARQIADQMRHQQEPQVYDYRNPPALATDDPLYLLTQGVDVNEDDDPTDIPFLSRAGFPFRAIAKNRAWNQDFWIDLVGPHLGVNMDVETWRRGTEPGDEDSDGTHTTEDVLHITFEPLGYSYQWHYTKDHAKWGISDEGQADGAKTCTACWICVADINRQDSQEKRGGGTICLQIPRLWADMSQVEVLVEAEGDP